MGEQVKVDFHKLKSAVTIENVLARYGVQIRHTAGAQLVADCPLPTHTSKESRNSFKVNSEKGIWCCKSESCAEAYKKKLGGKRGGDSLDLVALKEGVSILEAAKLMLQWFPENVSGEKVQPPPSAAQPSAVAGINKPLTFSLKGISYCDYLEKRGIAKETAGRFGVGFFPGKGSMAGRVVIPIHNEKGELLAYAGRALNGEEPRYKLPEGFFKSLVLYNLHRIGDQAESVVLVEGFFSIFWLTQCGFPNVLGLMGHTISDAQLALLNFSKVILMLDECEKGNDDRIRTAARIASKTFVHSVTSNGKQPDQLTIDELKAILMPLL